MRACWMPCRLAIRPTGRMKSCGVSAFRAGGAMAMRWSCRCSSGRSPSRPQRTARSRFGHAWPARSRDLRGFRTAAATGPAAAVESSRLVLEAIERDGEVSPFVRDSFEPVLRIVSSQLDPEGVYLGSDHDWFKQEDCSADAAEHLAVSDRWVIFARPRTKSLVLRDIERFRDEIDRIAKVDGEIPMLARVLAFGSSDDAATGMRQALSGVIGRPIDIEPVAEHSNAEFGDLFFPLPSNADQIDAVRRLQTSDGLVMRAAPGPAKANAIVNIVCHHLALGQRVLVVCRGNATLEQLHDKFPAAIRDLAIGLTGGDRRDLAQVEAAVRRLQSIVETIKPRDHVELINKLESDVIATRRLISDLTEEASNIARNTPGSPRCRSIWRGSSSSRRICMPGSRTVPRCC